MPDDLTPEEQKELENIRRRKQELLDDIQVMKNRQLQLNIHKSVTLCYIKTYIHLNLSGLFIIIINNLPLIYNNFNIYIKVSILICSFNHFMWSTL